MVATRGDVSDLNTELASETRAYVEQLAPRRHRPWQRWIDAELGFRGYWYPAMRSIDLAEGAAVPITILDEEILVVRHGDRLFAVENRCAHRGTRFSERPLMLSEDTITCWYHTWTYDMTDGRLRCILNDPESVLAGKVKIRAYEIQEAKGLIFVYIGDGVAPALERDVPATFLEEDVAIHVAEPGDIEADWRLCLENAFDPGHHFLHNWSPFVIESGFPMTFGYVAKRGEEHSEVTFHTEGPGPVGFSRCTKTTELIFQSVIPGRDGRPDTVYTAPGAVGRSHEELISTFMAMDPIRIYIFLPCNNTVTNFPGDLTYYEWCIPIEPGRTRYIICGGKRVKSTEEAESWLGQEGYDSWKVPVVDKFFADDNMARESLQQFYGDEDGWYRERLYRPDLELAMFRKFFSEHGGELQPTARISTRSGHPAGA